MEVQDEGHSHQMDKETSYGCSTSNRFEILKIPIREPTIFKGNKPTIKPPSPITIIGDIINVRAFMKKHNHDKFVLENLKSPRDDPNLRRTKVFCNDHKQFELLVKQLEDCNIQFFHYGLQTEKLKRFVLYGLNQHPIVDIMDELEKYGIRPHLIKEMRVKKARYIDHCNYLVYYENNSGVTLNVLRQASYILSQKVYWNNYINNGDGVTLCRRCFRFGHSTSNCNLSPRCGVCAGYHPTYNCEHILGKRAANKTSIDNNLLKCANCQGPHTASYLNCPLRRKYIENKKSNMARLSNPPQNYVPAPPPEKNFWNTPQFTTSHRSAANNSAPSSPATQQRHSEQPHSASDNNQNRFNPKQIMEIVTRVINCIEKAATKAEQLNIVMEIITSYYI